MEGFSYFMVAVAASWSILAGTTSLQITQSNPDPIDARVAALIKQAVKRETQAKAFRGLESLGCPAVPSIIRRMNDRRKLPDPAITLKNKSRDAFEAFRFYGPEQVVDALAAILNQLTGKDFGFISNGGTDDERTATVQGWSRFLRETPRDQLCAGG